MTAMNNNAWLQLNANEGGAFNGGIFRGAPRMWRRRPSWTEDHDQIKKLLFTVFPKMETDPVQKKRAERWAVIIYLYYVVRLPPSRVARAINVSVQSVKDTLCRIRRAGRGLRTTGRKRTGRKPGRPRKLNSLNYL